MSRTTHALDPKTVARIVHVMRDEPDLPDTALAERFGVSVKTLSDLRAEHGCQRVRVTYSVRRSERRRTRG